MIYVNSIFLTQNMTGIQRYSVEISLRLKEFFGDDIVFLTSHNIIHHDIATKLEAKVIGTHIKHFWEQYDLPKFLYRNGIPLLVNFNMTAPIFYKNCINSIHDLAPIHYPELSSRKVSIGSKIYIPFLLKNAKHVIVVSGFVKDDIINRYHLAKDKISIVYNSFGIQFSNANLMRNSYIFTIGIDSRKNLIRIIEVFKNFPHIEILIAGSGRFDVALPNVDIKALPSNIKFIGRISDEELVEYYNKAKLFLFPSLYEGFGIPPLEAQACGCPVIASKVTSLPEVCRESVLYCDPYSVNDIRVKIEQLYYDTKLQDELRAKGFENIKRFSWDESAKKVIEVIERFKQ